MAPNNDKLARLLADTGAEARSRLAAHTTVDQAGCWLWGGDKNNKGYGQVGFTRASLKGTVLAHRLAWAVHNGSIPGGMVLHKCDVRNCINPDHLFLGDNSANMKDAIAKGRWHGRNFGKTHCKNGHPFNDTNTYLNGGRRVCRECFRAYDRNWKKQKRIQMRQESAHG